jgi:hypothetical protein
VRSRVARPLFCFHLKRSYVLVRAGAFASDRAGSDACSLTGGANGGDASAPLAAMMCCCQACPSAIIRSNAPRAQSWYACIRSTIVCVLHMRSEHSDADLVPVWRRSNQLFENACMLVKNLSWFSQKRWAFSRNVVETSEVGRNTFCIIDVHCSAKFVVVMLSLLYRGSTRLFLKDKSALRR